MPQQARERARRDRSRVRARLLSAAAEAVGSAWIFGPICAVSVRPSSAKEILGVAAAIALTTILMAVFLYWFQPREFAFLERRWPIWDDVFDWWWDRQHPSMWTDAFVELPDGRTGTVIGLNGRKRTAKVQLSVENGRTDVVTAEFKALSMARDRLPSPASR